jgi:hypothetical protein
MGRWEDLPFLLKMTETQREEEPVSRSSGTRACLVDSHLSKETETTREGAGGEKKDWKYKAQESADEMRNNPFLLQLVSLQNQHYSVEITQTVALRLWFATHIRPVTTDGQVLSGTHLT